MNGTLNKAAIGAFVLGALILLVAGVLVFGSGKLFSDTGKLAVYFEGSVKGLSIGSPVMFRGVKVGSVTDIQIDFDPQELAVTIPVIIEIERDKFRGMETDRAYLQDLIAKGLRAQLQMQSMVTGQLAIYLDFYPGTPVVLRARDGKYLEVPTILSTTEELQKTLAELPLEDLIEKMHSAMDGFDRLVNAPGLHDAIGSLDTALQDIREMVRTVESEVQSLGEESRRTAANANRALLQVEQFLAMEEGASAEIARNLNQTLEDARITFQEAEKTLAAVRKTAADERTSYQLQQALREMAEAARSINSLAEYLDRHPEALLRGKGDPQGE